MKYPVYDLYLNKVAKRNKTTLFILGPGLGLEPTGRECPTSACQCQDWAQLQKEEAVEGLEERLHLQIQPCHSQEPLAQSAMYGNLVGRLSLLERTFVEAEAREGK